MIVGRSSAITETRATGGGDQRGPGVGGVLGSAGSTAVLATMGSLKESLRALVG
ncbi:MAG: hypothetical protein ACRDPD_06415 [Streptosporangiaceae bacterium]